MTFLMFEVKKSVYIYLRKQSNVGTCISQLECIWRYRLRGKSRTFFCTAGQSAAHSLLSPPLKKCKNLRSRFQRVMFWRVKGKNCPQAFLFFLFYWHFLGRILLFNSFSFIVWCDAEEDEKTIWWPRKIFVHDVLQKIEARIYIKSLYMIFSKYVQVFVYNRDVQYVYFILFIQREKKACFKKN